MIACNDKQSDSESEIALHYLVSAPKSLRNEKRSIKDIENIIHRKIEERTSRSNDQFRQSFKLFNRGRSLSGLTKDEFNEHLKCKLGLVLTSDEINTLFTKYDVDKNGVISFMEFVSHVMPKDFPRKTWVEISEEAREKKNEERK